MPDSHGIPTGFSYRQMQVVRETFAKIEPNAQQATIVFYTRLFDLDPGLKTLFKADRVEQNRELMSVLKVILANLEDRDRLVAIVEVIAKRHRRDAIKPIPYDALNLALMWTLEHSLGEAFTPEVEDAWSDIYETLTAPLKKAAHAR